LHPSSARLLVLPPVRYAATTERVGVTVDSVRRPPVAKELVGVDVFVDWRGVDPEQLGPCVNACSGDGLQLSMVANRGVKVWPGGLPETFCTDHWRCRFLAEGSVSPGQVIALLSRLAAAGLEFIKTEHLYTFGGKPGFSVGQGE